MLIDEIEAEADSYLIGNDSIQTKIEKLLENFAQHEDLMIKDVDDEQIFQQIDFLYTQKLLGESFEVYEPSDSEDEEVDEDESAKGSEEESQDQNDNVKGEDEPNDLNSDLEEEFNEYGSSDEEMNDKLG